MADADTRGYPTGDPATWPIPPGGGTWRPVQDTVTMRHGAFLGFALDTPKGTGYVTPDEGHWVIDPDNDEDHYAAYENGDEAVRALADWFSR